MRLCGGNRRTFSSAWPRRAVVGHISWSRTSSHLLEDGRRRRTPPHEHESLTERSRARTARGRLTVMLSAGGAVFCPGHEDPSVIFELIHSSFSLAIHARVVRVHSGHSTPIFLFRAIFRPAWRLKFQNLIYCQHCGLNCLECGHWDCNSKKLK